MSVEMLMGLEKKVVLMILAIVQKGGTLPLDQHPVRLARKASTREAPDKPLVKQHSKGTSRPSATRQRPLQPQERPRWPLAPTRAMPLRARPMAWA